MSNVRSKRAEEMLIILSEQEELSMLIKNLVNGILECELTEENGWTPYDLYLLNKLKEEEFEVNFVE